MKIIDQKRAFCHILVTLWQQIRYEYIHPLLRYQGLRGAAAWGKGARREEEGKVSLRLERVVLAGE